MCAILLVTGCATLPPGVPAFQDGEISFAQTQQSEKKKFIATLRPLAEPVAINHIHSWRITVTGADGRAIEKALIHLGGGMPEHGHGFPTRPRISEIGGGDYLLEGMKFSMHGRWEIKLGVQVSEDYDVLTFNTLVALPPAR